MRVVKQTTLPGIAITLFAWNGKYLLKFEQDVLEQTYKVSELDLTSADDLDKLLANEAFITHVNQTFVQMRGAWFTALEPYL